MVRVGFVLHVMQVAGAEVLVAETIRRLKGRVDPVILCLDRVGQLGSVMMQEGVPVIAYKRKPGLDLGLSRRMAADIRRFRLDVVHAHQYTPFFYSAIAARLCGVRPRVILTEHGRHFPDVVSARRRRLNSLIFDRLADEVTAVCAFSADSLAAKDGFTRSRIRVIPNGVEMDLYRPDPDPAALRVRLGLDPQRKYVAQIARFHPVKDHAMLIRAFGRVASARSDVDLLLVGDGDLRVDLTQQVESLGIASRVRFLGIRQDVADILRAIDVFTLSSVSEAASITLLEAMATATPVVVTAVGGNPELVRDGIDGLLVPRGDDAAMAQALLRILGDAALARRMGDAGRHEVEARFQLSHTIDAYARLYERGGRNG